MWSYNYTYPNYLAHYGVLGMKWGVRHSKTGYKSTSIRSAIARRQNDSVDASFKKWGEGTAKKQSAIDLGKKRNASKIAYEKSRTKETKAQYKADNKAYKKALRSNTTYRKGSVRAEVGKDLSSKYLREAKAAQKAGDSKSYETYMNKYDVERASARKAQSVGAARSQRIATAKGLATKTVKGVATAAAVYAGAKAYENYTGKQLNVDALGSAVKMGKKIMQYIY